MTLPTRDPLVTQTARSWEEREFDRFLAGVVAQARMLKNLHNFKPLKVGAALQIKIQSRFDA